MAVRSQDVVVAAAVAAILLASAPESHADTQIVLTGNILRKCTLDVTPDANASNLSLTAAGAQRVRIGTAAQDCNGRTGYTLEVFSTNCPGGVAGAKLNDPVSSEALNYSVESENPTTGGSAALVTGLLATTCTGQVARDVTHAIVHNEVSTLYVAYTGSASLSAGTYQDTLTVTLTAK